MTPQRARGARLAALVGCAGLLLLPLSLALANHSFAAPLAERAPAKAPITAIKSVVATKSKDRVAPQEEMHGTKAESRTRRQLLTNVHTWAIQLRYPDREAIARSPYDLIVMDYAPHPLADGEAPFSQADILPLKKKPDGSRRIVLSYLSIGEAERYRYYWQDAWDQPGSAPAWLLPQNPQWAGNFYVRYGDPDWQAIIFGTPDSYLDRIIAAGFDGVYLDRADAFQDEGQTQSDAEDAMVRFVSRICDHARRLNPSFLIVMQNAEELLRHVTLRQRLDGVAKEDLSFGFDNSTNANPPNMVRDSLRYLRKARSGGMGVLTLEYVKSSQSISAASKLAEREGFVLFLGDRLLDSLPLPSAASPASLSTTPSPEQPGPAAGGDVAR